ncbi:MAG: NADH-quinone oxidoreductase subunit D [Actinomycetota bacterium]|nr:NADH-quinone oxidoreductase subunit D [Actinomycetota bacterium]
MQELLVAVGAARYLDHDVVLELDDLHPATHAALQIRITLDDQGLISAADPQVGLLHRSAEKLFEARDYRQILMLANRHDWLSAFSSELGVALTVEAAMGIHPPPRATWTRTLLAEMNRVSASLLLLGAPTRDLPLLQLRERFLTLQELASGGRVHPMINRIGGLAHPLTTQWLAELAILTTELSARLPAIGAATEAATAAFAGRAVLSRATAMTYGVTGPVGRASGLDLDRRRDEPYLAYGELAEFLIVPTSTDGDLPARYRLLLDQIPVSLRLMAACAEHVLGAGAIDVPLPKVIKVPESTTYGQVEGPLGVSGYLLVSVGTKSPWRLKLRTPSLSNVQAMAAAVIGLPLADLGAALMSFFFVVGDIDR